MFRMSANSAMSVLNLDDRIPHLQLTQGVLNVRVRWLAAVQMFEIATPNLAFTVREPGDYRIVVNGDGQSTDVVVRRGRGDAYGDGLAYRIDSSQSYRSWRGCASGSGRWRGRPAPACSRRRSCSSVSIRVR